MAEEQSTQSPLAEWVVETMPEGTAVALSQRLKWFVLPQKIISKPQQRPAQRTLRTELEAAGSTVGTNGGVAGSNFVGMTIEPPHVHSAPGTVTESFSMVRKYEGHVIRHNSETFWAEFRETPSDFPPIEVEFDLDVLPPSDRSLAVEGVPLVWTVGFDIQDGTHRQQSIVYVRRIPWPSSADVQTSTKLVKDRMRAITWQ
jgi:hypothetical protein